MAKTTAIAWTRSTFNPWVGCTKVGPGCDNCYAEAVNLRWRAGENWGPGAPRARTGEKNWQTPKNWNAQAAIEHRAGIEWAAGQAPGFWPVFCASHADVFDNEVDPAWRADLWRVIRETPNLTWQLVTKRAPNIAGMLPPDWGAGYPNVWLLATIVDQREADRDLPKLLRIPAALHGVSYEPALGPVEWLPFLPFDNAVGRSEVGPHGLRWIITGGESQQRGQARDFDLQWGRDAAAACAGADVAHFMKQVGSHPYQVRTEGEGRPSEHKPFYIEQRKGDDPAEFPLDLRQRQFPGDGGTLKPLRLVIA